MPRRRSRQHGHSQRSSPGPSPGADGGVSAVAMPGLDRVGEQVEGASPAAPALDSWHETADTALHGGACIPGQPWSLPANRALFGWVSRWPGWRATLRRIGPVSLVQGPRLISLLHRLPCLQVYWAWRVSRLVVLTHWSLSFEDGQINLSY